MDEVKLDRGHISVSAAKAKTARRRLVPIAPNLKEWLKPFVAQNGNGKVWPSDFQHYHAAVAELCQATGIKWQLNGLRHSFASYHLAKHGDAARLALDLGHTTTNLIFSNYRELVTPEDAGRYWNIFPEGGAK